MNMHTRRALARLTGACLLSATLALAGACSHASSISPTPLAAAPAASAPRAAMAAAPAAAREATAAPEASAAPPASAPAPLLAKGEPVKWWFVFKFNTAAFPACHGGATRICLFGGDVQDYGGRYGQQFVYASSADANLKMGSDCLGDTTADPVGATFDEVYNGDFYYVVWSDQFYLDPAVCGSASKSCGPPWAHSKGLLAWNDAGDGFVMQVTTPSWPGAGSKDHPRKPITGNTLGCISTNNNIRYSQHFFALELRKDDLVKVLRALVDARVATDPGDPQIVRNGGPAEVQALVGRLGTRSTSTRATIETLSSGVELISKPAQLHVPPWQLVSAELGGVSLRVASWWTRPAIPPTTASTVIGCWSTDLGSPGAVQIATSGQWEGTTFGLKGGAPNNDLNHAKIGVSTEADKPEVIFGDMNQQGSLAGTAKDCARSQNGRGGLFYVIKNVTLARNITELLQGSSAAAGSP